jgi:hypothetical protein
MGDRDRMKSCASGQLDGIGTHVAGCADNQHTLPGSYVRILKEHLPSRHRYYGNRSRLNVVEQLWLMGHHRRPDQCVLGVCSAELRIGDSVYFSAFRESVCAGSHSFDHAR